MITWAQFLVKLRYKSQHTRSPSITASRKRDSDSIARLDHKICSAHHYHDDAVCVVASDQSVSMDVYSREQISPVYVCVRCFHMTIKC